MAVHIFRAIAEALGGISVQRGEAAFQRAGEDEAQAILDNVFVTRFAGQQSLFCLALAGHVATTDDQVLHFGDCLSVRGQVPL